MVEQITFDFEQKPTIKGYPELRWTGKRPYRSTQYYPAQLKETYGKEQNGCINKIYWGDNLQVMSHLLKDYRGKIDLIYIDPPFDSKADYKKKIEIRGVGSAESDMSSFEEKQYGDIWANDEYLQFMYERLILCRELLSSNGSIYVHMDENRAHYIKVILDEIFGSNNFKREIIWRIGWISGYKSAAKQWIRNHDEILYYTKSSSYTFNKKYIPYPDGYTRRDGAKPEGKGYPIEDTWNCSELDPLNSIQIMSFSSEKVGYRTQKNENLVARIIEASSNPGDLVLDCFMGSGTTQAVAMKLGRRFIGADINLGAIQTTTKRLIAVADGIHQQESQSGVFDTEQQPQVKYTGFEVYNVNNYDFFRNPLEARDLIIKALEIQPFPRGNVWDGELDGRMVKIMPVNRIATKADLKELIANLPYKTYDKLKEENPNQPVERITIVCMGHEPDLKGALEQALHNYKIDVQIVDILRDKKELQLKRDSEAEVVREGNKLVIRSFYPMNLMQKLSLQKEYVDDWRMLVDSIMIDWNYDGAIMQPTVIDIPEKNKIVKGIYDIPEDAGSIKVKITDLLSESLEVEVR